MDLDDVDRDDVERARRADLGDRFGFAVIKGRSSDDDLGFVGFAILLALDDPASEDDVFEIEDREVVIVQFFGGVGDTTQFSERTRSRTQAIESRGTPAILRERVWGA